MRKLLILALIAVAALVVMGADYTRDPNAGNYFADVTKEGDVEVYVHQWLDLTVTISGEIHIYDYNTDYSGDVGNVSIGSNADVSVLGSVSGDGAGLVSDLKLDGTTILNTPANFAGGNYDLFLHVQAGQDVPASSSSYTVHITLTFNPTVTL